MAFSCRYKIRDVWRISRSAASWNHHPTFCKAAIKRRPLQQAGQQPAISNQQPVTGARGIGCVLAFGQKSSQTVGPHHVRQHTTIARAKLASWWPMALLKGAL